MLKVIRATVLILTLSGSVFAGDIQNGLQPTPTPPPATRSVEEPTEVLVTDEQPQPTTTTVEITLNLVQIVLAFF